MLYELVQWLWLFGEGEPEVPPPPPLPVRVEVDVTQCFWWLPSAGPLFVAGGPDEGESPELRRVDPPKTENVPLPTSDPAVVRVIERWAEAVKDPKPRTVPVHRYIYDSVFGVEKRAQGELVFDETTVQFTMQPDPAVTPEMTNPHRVTRAGKPFHVQTDGYALLTLDRQSLAVRFEPDGFRHRMDMPFDWRTSDRPVPMAPFLEPFRPFDAAKRSREFRIEFGPRNEPERRLHLVLKGTSRAWSREYQSVDVMLDALTCEPIAMRSIDPSGTRETVYVYNDSSR